MWLLTNKSEVWLLARNASKGESKIVVLQWKILHHIFHTNEYLHKLKVIDYDYCEKCNLKDSTEHYFIECAQVVKLWLKVQGDIQIVAGKNFLLNEKNIIIGFTSNDMPDCINLEIMNMYILVAKLTITKYKYKENSKQNNNDIVLMYEHEKMVRGLK